MADDIGPGDVVECTVSGSGVRRGALRLGGRYVVEGASAPAYCMCGRNDKRHGILLAGLRSGSTTGGWCSYSFRKIGGSQADTVRRFAEDLTPATPETVDA